MATEKPAQAFHGNELDGKNARILIWANAIMLLVIFIHDADHIRQAINWNYTISSSLLLINSLVYIPNAAALALAAQRRGSAAILTSAGTLFLVASFAETHLWRPTLQVWGVWNKSFFELNVDAVSWVILAGTLAAGVGVAMAGAYVAGALSAQRG
jgi:hypothetical protein